MLEKFLLYRDAYGSYRFRVQRPDGRIVFNSEGYRTKNESLKELRRIQGRILRLESAKKREVRKPKSRMVFVAHGKDNYNKEILQKMLKQWKLEPVIIANLPHEGVSLLDKVISYAGKVSYGFVLMTPDDLGALRSRFKRGNLKNRGRQNVVFEYGLLIGLLGKENTCLIIKESGIEKPSDINGQTYVSFDSNISERREEIRRELGVVFRHLSQ